MTSRLPRFMQSLLGMAAATMLACAPASSTPAGDVASAKATVACHPVDITLAEGFCATIFADSLGAARHMAVAPNGDVFVNLQRPRPRSAVASVTPGQVGLRDSNGDGRADRIERFGTAGNTGIALYNGYLYVDEGQRIVRYRLATGQLRPDGAAEVVVSGIPVTGHRARNFVITRDGTLYMNSGSATNACQERDRQAGSTGVPDCPELSTRAGIWAFSANTLNQTFSPAGRYATGLRNTVALTLDPSGTRLYGAVHGRDNLSSNWSANFTQAQNAELPAEELVQIERGDHFGWPFCYYDGQQNRKVLATEYGGNGSTVGRCSQFKNPLMALPAHWAPNGILFYTGDQFPERYRNGVFIAFHGSWNRAPLPQGGFNVTFVPMRGGHPSGTYEVFAHGFAQSDSLPNGARHRPTGLAQAPDGSIYVSDDVGGRIWKISYRR